MQMAGVNFMIDQAVESETTDAATTAADTSLDQERPPSASVFPIIGIGSSAGGLLALEQFFHATPNHSGMAFVLVQHLDPHHNSQLTSILKRATVMPTLEVYDNMPVLANHVYVIPPNREMTISQGVLRLKLRPPSHEPAMPIDIFLCSLAQDRGQYAIGIILSGTGSDGALGLRDIITGGGISIVQDPTSAKYNGMPSAAIKAGYATHVLPTHKMFKGLLSHRFALGTDIDSRPIQSSDQSSSQSGEIHHVLAQLHDIVGHDFSQYKKSNIRRRIERRMEQNNIVETEVYARYIKQYPDEAHTLLKDLLINVTGFFRDPDAFAALSGEILPQLLADKGDNIVFRAWVAACSSGEEVFSIAILLHELMNASGRDFTVQLFATDLDDDAIRIGRAGLYPDTIADSISVERLAHFFIKENGGYRVKKMLREMVTFAVQNAVKDPPITNLDMVSCRNMMIYLEPELQNRLISTFHYALKPGGILFLSPSENIGNHTDLFAPVNRQWKFYQAVHDVAAARTCLIPPHTWTARNNDHANSDQPLTGIKVPNTDMRKPKKTNGDIPAEPAFMPDQANNMQQVAAESASIGSEFSIRSNGDLQAVTFDVRPLPYPDTGTGAMRMRSQRAPAAPPALQSAIASAAGSNEAQARIQTLEHDLLSTKNKLQAISEEQASCNNDLLLSNEEMQAANEELQTTNEELQTTNEELQTTKEELQSANEEFITVNAELQAKIEQLWAMKNDIKNLLNSIHIGTIFLDRELFIRRFNRDAANVYRLLASDVGRPLSDINSNMQDNDLLAHAQQVLESLTPYERELQTDQGIWYLARIQPYSTIDNAIDGVVLTFDDISKRVAAEAAVRLAQTKAKADTANSLLLLDDALNVNYASHAFYRQFQLTPHDTLGRKIYDLGNRQWDIASLRELLETVLPREQSFDGYLMEADFPEFGHRKILLAAKCIAKENNGPHLILITMENML
jgi:two-component system CheB/CheR fusion protein